jgi:hypothetical protein
MARKLRIAASVFFAVLTVALCVLWVRSYWWVDSISRQAETIDLEIVSRSGKLSFMRYVCVPKIEVVYTNWHVRSHPVNSKVGHGFYYIEDAEKFPFALIRSGRFATVSMPYWCPVITTVLLAVLPWFLWLTKQLGPRRMLVATTLVAVVLGLGVWLAS